MGDALMWKGRVGWIVQIVRDLNIRNLFTE